MARYTFRRLGREDFALLAGWLAEGHVLRWWNHEFTPEAVERDFGPVADGSEPSEDHLGLLDDRPLGLVQYSMYASYPEYRDEVAPYLDVPEGAATIDYLIGDPELVGRGFGTAMIEAFCRWIWTANPAATCVIVPVNSANEASWRMLLRAGFRIVAHGDISPDNPIDDPAHVILRLDRPIG